MNLTFMLHGLAERLARCHIPEPRSLIHRGGDHSLAIGTELRRMNLTLMLHALAYSFDHYRVPEPCSLIP
jgi:hypothetical protein